MLGLNGKMTATVSMDEFVNRDSSLKSLMSLGLTALTKIPALVSREAMGLLIDGGLRVMVIPGRLEHYIAERIVTALFLQR